MRLATNAYKVGKSGAVVIRPPRSIGVLALGINTLRSVAGLHPVSRAIYGLSAISNARLYVEREGLCRVVASGKSVIALSAPLAAVLKDAGVSEIMFRKGTSEDQIRKTLDDLTCRGLRGLSRSLGATVAVNVVHHRETREVVANRYFTADQRAVLVDLAKSVGRDEYSDPDLIDAVARLCKNFLIPSAVSALYQQIANNPNTPLQTFNYLAEVGDVDVLLALAKRYGEMPAIAARILRSSDIVSIRRAVAETTTNLDVLRAMSSDEYFVVDAVARNPRTSPEVMAQAINGISKIYDLNKRDHVKRFNNSILTLLKEKYGKGNPIILTVMYELRHQFPDLYFKVF